MQLLRVFNWNFTVSDSKETLEKERTDLFKLSNLLRHTCYCLLYFVFVVLLNSTKIHDQYI